MANAQSKTEPAISGAPVTRVLREAAFWLLCAVALILFIALATFDPDDPGFWSAGGLAGAGVNNLVGEAGAWFADVAYILFGRPAFLFPIMVGLAGVMLFRVRRNPEPLARRVLALRFGGFLITLASSCALATLHFSAGVLPETAGGVLGQIVGNGLSSLLSTLGATLMLLALWLAGVSLFTGVSWLKVMDSIGQSALWAVDQAGKSFRSLRARLSARRERRAAQQVRETRSETRLEVMRKRETREAPRIAPIVRPVEPSRRVERERQVPLFSSSSGGAVGGLPPLSLLDNPPPRQGGYSEETLAAMSQVVELKLRDFGVEVEVVSVHPGPVITRFELQPAAGVKVSQITNLSKDLARALSTVSVRVVEIIPGKSYVGLEIPNETRELVTLGEIIQSRAYDELKSPLALALGKDIAGQPIVADLARMPHLLIAGTTGSGKSVAINAMILSLLYKSTPEQVRLIMIDPKMLELSVYEGIPHLLAPVVTDMNEAANALRWCVAEMERRYRLMAALGVRNIGGFNRKLAEAKSQGKEIPDPMWQPPPPLTVDEDPPPRPALEPLPLIVVIIDELADMMMVVGKKVEELIARLAQKARASGIHMMVATQRPSVDVITGLIKANIPTRIAFQVSARVDSRTILDQQGAENLLGHGDMLFLPPGTPVPTRVHGAFVSDDEVHKVVEHLKANSDGPQYFDEILEGPSAPLPGFGPGNGGGGDDPEQDPLYDEAVRIVVETRKASISGVQRRLKIGYNRAARMVETMEAAGLVGPLQSNGNREVLVPPGPED